MNNHISCPSHCCKNQCKYGFDDCPVVNSDSECNGCYNCGYDDDDVPHIQQLDEDTIKYNGEIYIKLSVFNKLLQEFYEAILKIYI